MAPTESMIDLRRNGAEALRRADFATARAAFERLVERGEADINIFLALAGCRGRLSDLRGAHEAVDRALSMDARNLRALIVKADLCAAERDARAASAFYLQAVRLAPAPNELPADLRADVERAQRACQGYAQAFESALMSRLVEHGYAPRPSLDRFSQSLELLFGRKQVYLQQPKYFYFPELPQIQFYPRDRFPWLDAIERATEDIRAELLAVLEDETAFKPYVEANPRRPSDPSNRMIGNPEWSAFYLWKYGEIVPENAARCPRTLAALESVPAPRMRHRSPSILFSLMKPGAHIPPHNGFVNTRLICHLPLIVPEGCTFRVGNDVRPWVEGKAWVFDDTIEHEAWNRSDRTRVVLLFETWRPELSDEERALVGALFDAIDAHGGTEPAWEI